MDDKRAALVLAGLALAGAAVKLLLAPPAGRAPGEVTLTADTAAQPAGLRATAREAARLARPLAPGEHQRGAFVVHLSTINGSPYGSGTETTRWCPEKARCETT